MGQETIVTNEVVCPCGQGTILTERTEYDNGWSRDDISSHIACRTCASKFVLVERHQDQRGLGPGYALGLITDGQARGELWRRRDAIRTLVQRDYCQPVIDRLVALARGNEGRGGKRKAWHAALSRWEDVLKLPPAGATWMLETFVHARVNLANVAPIAVDLGLATGLATHLTELAEVENALNAPLPRPLIWNGPASH